MPCGLFFGSSVQSAIMMVVLAAVSLFSLSGCATLPDASTDRNQPHTKLITLDGAHGEVPAARSDAILDKLTDGTNDGDPLQRHLAYEQAINIDSPLVIGNKVTLLQNGPDTYRAMLAAIRTAKNHINMETYILDDGITGVQFSDALLERQSAGVQVSIIYDSIGSLLTTPAFYDRLRKGGIQLLEFNPVNPLVGNKRSWLLNNRDHRRQLIIDGHTAFTGGINISDTYSSAPSSTRSREKIAKNLKSTGGWRDTHISIEGPVVAEFQKLFIDTWARQKGVQLATRDYFPTLKSHGNEIVRVIGSTPTAPKNLIYLTLMSAITHAQSEAHFTIAYFAPDPQLLKALVDAAQRGVDVRLVLPEKSDSWAIFHLGRSYYTKLLRGGVRIHERRGSVMHAKTVCIDEIWSSVGSSNMDLRSFLHNDEINAVILGHDFSRQMNVMFSNDVNESNEITLQKWKKRSLMMKIKEKTARLGAYWL